MGYSFIKKAFKIIKILIGFEIVIYIILEAKQFLFLLFLNQGIITGNDLGLFILNIFLSIILLLFFLSSQNSNKISKKRFLTLFVALVFIPLIRITSILLSNVIGKNRLHFTGYGYEQLTIFVQQKIAVINMVLAVAILSVLYAFVFDKLLGNNIKVLKIDK
jgi:hypothetical protein